jgi:hypothetical protein
VAIPPLACSVCADARGSVMRGLSASRRRMLVGVCIVAGLSGLVRRHACGAPYRLAHSQPRAHAHAEAKPVVERLAGAGPGWNRHRTRRREPTLRCLLRGDARAGRRAVCRQGPPLVVMDMNNAWVADVDIHQDFLSKGWPWSSPIQLVLCARSEKKMVGSCGTYTSEGGIVGEVVRRQEVMTVRVIVAATGKELQKRVIKSAAAKCPRTLTVAIMGEWAVWNEVTPAQINDYARAVSKQKVK